MTEVSTMQSVENVGIVNEIEIILFGLIVTLFCAWLFVGYGYWLLPGLVILFFGFSELINKLYMKKTEKTGVRVGLNVTMFGLAGYLSFAQFVVFGVPQILFVVILILGLILLIKGFLAK